jgi:hypothetical protein
MGRSRQILAGRSRRDRREHHEANDGGLGETALPKSADCVPSVSLIFLLSLSSFSFVRNGQGVPGEAGSLAGERGEKKEERERERGKKKDSGGDITSRRARSPAAVFSVCRAHPRTVCSTLFTTRIPLP